MGGERINNILKKTEEFVRDTRSLLFDRLLILQLLRLEFLGRHFRIRLIHEHGHVFVAPPLRHADHEHLVGARHRRCVEEVVKRHALRRRHHVGIGEASARVQRNVVQMRRQTGRLQIEIKKATRGAQMSRRRESIE